MRSNYILLFLEFYVFSSNGLHYSLQVLRKSYLYGEYLSIQVAYFPSKPVQMHAPAHFLVLHML